MNNDKNVFIKTVLILVFVTIFSFLFISCGSADNEKDLSNHLPDFKQKRKSLNIIVLLTLSNRMTSDQVARDTNIIEEQIFKLFENIQQNSKFVSKDILTIAIAPQTDFTLAPSKSSNLPIDMADLSIDMAEITNSKQPKLDFKKKKEALLKYIKEDIYNVPVNNSQSSGDVYEFFKNSLSTKIKPSKNYHNKLIILTDGYLSFKDNINRPKNTFISERDLEKLRKNRDWMHIFENENMKLKSVPLGAENLEILMLEINPKTFQQTAKNNSEIVTEEMDILDKFWQTWFENSGIYDVEIKKRQVSVIDTKGDIDNFLKKKSLSDKMKIDLDMQGENYKASLIKNQKEIVAGKNGKWFIIDLTNASTEKVVYFEKGNYVLKNPKDCQKAINEFIRNILNKLDENNFKNYEIYVKGGADELGKNLFEKEFNKGFEYRQICFLPKYKNSDYLFAAEEECRNIAKVDNKNLPNLRAKFLKEEFDRYFVPQYKQAKILDGSVVNFVSEYERNGTLILFLPKEFFNE